MTQSIGISGSMCFTRSRTNQCLGHRVLPSHLPLFCQILTRSECQWFTETDPGALPVRPVLHFDYTSVCPLVPSMDGPQISSFQTYFFQFRVGFCIMVMIFSNSPTQHEICQLWMTFFVYTVQALFLCLEIVQMLRGLSFGIRDWPMDGPRLRFGQSMPCTINSGGWASS